MEPVIVTAFWDVGRADNCLLPRSNDKYYKEFSEWARIQNQLIVYTDNISSEKIKEIREQYGLLHRTKVVVMDDVFSVEKEMYDRMKTVQEIDDFIQSRYETNAMENNAKFVYAWFMKYWCISDAAQYVDDDECLAWFDFGFNHMDVCYTNMEEFDFLWQLDHKIDKIQIYSLVDIDKVHLFNSYQFLTDSITGVFYLLPVDKAQLFWQLIKNAMNSLLDLECIDDDQQLVLMACKNRPDIFDVHVSDMWYIGLKENGAGNLSVKQVSNKKKNFFEKLIYYIHIQKKIFKFLLREYNLAHKYYHG